MAVRAAACPSPTSIAFNAAGDAHVTLNGVGAPRSGEVHKSAGLTSLTGATVADTAAAGQPLPTTLPAWSIPIAAGAALVAGSLFRLERAVAAESLATCIFCHCVA